MYSPIEYIMGTILGTVAFVILLIMGALVVDGGASTLARDAIFACEVKNLQPIRKSFSTQVSCRPRTYGADTVNVKVSK